MAEPKNVYTLEDLRNWDSVARDLGDAPRYAVIGDPVEHAVSPALHNAALRSLGRREQCVRVQVSLDELGEALTLFRQHGFRGLKAGSPHKGPILSLLDEVADAARRIGEVNTVLFEEGRTAGFNTDAPGFRQAVRNEFFVDLSDLRVLILGASTGMGRAVAVQCADDRCERLVLVDKDVCRMAELAGQVRDPMTKGRFLGPVTRFEAIPWEEDPVAFALRQIDLIVNCTSIGMRRSDPRLLSPALIQPHHLLYDLICRPPRTRFLEDGVAEGARVANGQTQLLWQDAIALEFWLNSEPPIEVMRQALAEALA